MGSNFYWTFIYIFRSITRSNNENESNRIVVIFGILFCIIFR